MALSVFLRDYVENIKELKSLYNKKRKTLEIQSIYDYLKIVDLLQKEKDTDRSGLLKEYYFRGVSNKEWALLPSIAVNGLEYYEPLMVEEFKKNYPDEFKMESEFEVVAKMQHFGLPTRLLDFTTNPLVALYFACSDIQEKNKDGKVIVALPRNACYDSLEKYKDEIFTVHSNDYLATYLSDETLYTYLGMVYAPNSIYFKKPSYVTEREKRQCSIFLLFANSIYDYNRNKCITDMEANQLIVYGENYYTEKCNSKTSYLRLHDTLKRVSDVDYERNFVEIVIPSKLKIELLGYLETLGIKKNFLFPEMEYTAEYIKNKYKVAVDKFANHKFNKEYDL